VLNAAAAAAAVRMMGLEPEEIRAGVKSFRAVEHRLELALKRDGVEYLNDSIATTPESTIAALEALGRNVLLIGGGASKGCSFTRLGSAIAAHAREVFLIGATADEIEKAIRAQPRRPPVRRLSTLDEAVRAARAAAHPGDYVLLSPACPSYDQFTNFEERGRLFKKLVRESPSGSNGSEGSVSCPS
jgi:UDP-N-acetylmuramoylalanine--D-glutamate ligase